MLLKSKRIVAKTKSPENETSEDESYIRDHIHTNGIESFWNWLKRGL